MSNKKREKALAKLKSMPKMPTGVLAISDTLTEKDIKEAAQKVYEDILQYSIDLTAEDKAIPNSILWEDND